MFLFCGLLSTDMYCIHHLERFTHSNDAVQMAAEVAQHTLSSSDGDFLFANIYLFVKKNSRLL